MEEEEEEEDEETENVMEIEKKMAEERKGEFCVATDRTWMYDKEL